MYPCLVASTSATRECDPTTSCTQGVTATSIKCYSVVLQMLPSSVLNCDAFCQRECLVCVNEHTLKRLIIPATYVSGIAYKCLLTLPA